MLALENSHSVFKTVQVSLSLGHSPCTDSSPTAGLCALPGTPQGRWQCLVFISQFLPSTVRGTWKMFSIPGVTVEKNPLETGILWKESMQYELGAFQCSQRIFLTSKINTAFITYKVKFKWGRGQKSGEVLCCWKKGNYRTCNIGNLDGHKQRLTSAFPSSLQQFSGQKDTREAE